MMVISDYNPNLEAGWLFFIRIEFTTILGDRRAEGLGMTVKRYKLSISLDPKYAWGCSTSPILRLNFRIPKNGDRVQNLKTTVWIQIYGSEFDAKFQLCVAFLQPPTSGQELGNISGWGWMRALGNDGTQWFKMSSDYGINFYQKFAFGVAFIQSTPRP